MNINKAMRWSMKNIDHEALSKIYKQSIHFNLERLVNSCVIERKIEFKIISKNEKTYLNVISPVGMRTLDIKINQSLYEFRVKKFPPDFLFFLFNQEVFLSKYEETKAQKYFKLSTANTILALSCNKIKSRITKPRNYTEAESRCLAGHLRYPFPQLKEDFSIKDTVKYSNFCLKNIKTPLFKIKNNRYILCDPFNKWPFHEKNKKDEPLLPIHPWQYKNVSYIRKYLKEGGYLKFDSFYNFLPLVSTRTLSNLDSNFDIKLSLSAKITSEKRTIYQNRSHNAPIIAKIINEILEKEKIKRFSVQKDLASMRYFDLIKGPELTCILREGVKPKSKKSYILPATYLFDPFLKYPIKKEIAKYCISKPNTNPLEYFKKYSSLLITTPILLLNKYEIGLEPHLQNSLIEFREGEPQRLIIRDTDGANLGKSLINLNKNFEWHPLTKEMVLSRQFSAERLFHSMILSHLDIVIEFFVSCYDINIIQLKNIVRKKIVDSFNKSPSPQNIRYFLGKKVYIKNLLGMKLKNSEKFIISKINNPLL